MGMQSGSFASNTAITATTNLLLAGVGALTGILAARILGVDGRGELAAIQLWPALIAAVAMLGLPEAIVYNSARDRDHSAQYVATAVLLALAAGGLFVGVGYGAMPVLLAGQSADIVSAARSYLVLVPIMAIAGLPYHVLRGRGDFAGWNIVRMMPGTIWLAVLIGAATLGFASAQSVAAGYLGALLILGFGTAYFVMRRVPGSYVPSFGHVSPLLRFGLPSFSTTGPNLLAARLDQIVLVAFFTPTMLGLYVVAVGWAGAVTPLLSAIASVTFPRIAGITDTRVRNESFARAVRISVVAACVAVVPVALLAPVMLPLLFGADFSRAVTASVLLTISAAVSGVNQVLEEGLRGIGRPASILLPQAAGLAATVMAMVVLLPSWGIEGASVAAVAGTLTMFVALLLVVRNITGVSIAHLCVPTAEDIKTCAAHSAHAVRNWIPARDR